MSAFDRDTWRRIGDAIQTHGETRRERVSQSLLYGAVTAWGATNAAALAFDERDPTWRTQRIERPVFVVGNARSGTTLMHRLLAADESRFVAFRTWEIMLPALVQRRWATRLAAPLRGLGALWSRIEPAAIQEVRKFHPIGLGEPEEDEFLMLSAFASPVLSVLFPYLDELEDLGFFDARPDDARARVMEHYAGCVRRQLHTRGPGKRLLSKNPAFVSKLRTLIEWFPDAQFVYMVRDPAETLPSLMNALSSFWRVMGVSEARIDANLRTLEEALVRDYHYALEVLDALPAAQRCFVRYVDLVADPGAAVRHVYDALSWELTETHRAALERSGRRARSHRSQNRYTLAQFGLDERALRRDLAPVYERFSLDVAPSPPA